MYGFPELLPENQKGYTVTLHEREFAFGPYPAKSESIEAEIDEIKKRLTHIEMALAFGL